MLVLTRKIGECVSVPCCDLTIEVLLDPVLPWGGGDGVLACMREDKTVPNVPTLLHSWKPGSSQLDDDTFPIVRRTTKLLGLSQMEAEIRALCYHKHAMCSTRELDVVTAVAAQPCQR